MTLLDHRDLHNWSDVADHHARPSRDRRLPRHHGRSRRAQVRRRLPRRRGAVRRRIPRCGRSSFATVGTDPRLRRAASPARCRTGDCSPTSSSTRTSRPNIIDDDRRSDGRPVPTEERRDSPEPSAEIIGDRSAGGDRRADQQGRAAGRPSSSGPESRCTARIAELAGTAARRRADGAAAGPRSSTRGLGRAGSPIAVRHVPRALRQHVEDAGGYGSITSTAARSPRISASPRVDEAARSSAMCSAPLTPSGPAAAEERSAHTDYIGVRRGPAQAGYRRIAAEEDLAGGPATRVHRRLAGHRHQQPQQCASALPRDSATSPSSIQSAYRIDGADRSTHELTTTYLRRPTAADDELRSRVPPDLRQDRRGQPRAGEGPRSSRTSRSAG